MNDKLKCFYNQQQTDKALLLFEKLYKFLTDLVKKCQLVNV